MMIAIVGAGGRRRSSGHVTFLISAIDCLVERRDAANRGDRPVLRRRRRCDVDGHYFVSLWS